MIFKDFVVHRRTLVDSSYDLDEETNQPMAQLYLRTSERSPKTLDWPYNFLFLFSLSSASNAVDSLRDPCCMVRLQDRYDKRWNGKPGAIPPN